MEKLGLTHDKLTSTESEIRTLKTFLTTKTALIEKHKRELKDSRLRVAELEEKDSRRAVILADVLEKTARQYQQQLGGQAPISGGRSPKVKRASELQTMDESRLMDIIYGVIVSTVINNSFSQAIQCPCCSTRGVSGDR